MKLIKNWLEKIEEEDIKQDFLKRKEYILYTLLFEQSTETSLRLFDEVTIEFKRKINDRLTNIKQEKELIEQWKKENTQ